MEKILTPENAVVWENFPAYLIDHCEGRIISEEVLQHALADMLRDPKYSPPTLPNCTLILKTGVRLNCCSATFTPIAVKPLTKEQREAIESNNYFEAGDSSIDCDVDGVIDDVEAHYLKGAQP